MADNDRVMYPDEVEDAKAKAAEAAGSAGAGDTNSVENPEDATPKVALRNMIQVPHNCPEGYEMDANGVCREVF